MNRRSLTPEQVRKIREWWAQRANLPTVKEMAHLMGADRKAIERCAKGLTYRDVEA